MIWDGKSSTRPDSSVFRAPDAADWSCLLIALRQITSVTFKHITTESVQKGNIVRLAQDGTIKLASPSYDNIVGIAIENTNPGDIVTCYTQGILELENLEPGKDYFLINGGKMSINPPEIGWIHKVGYAISSKQFYFNRQTVAKI